MLLVQETPNGPTGNTIMTRKPDAWGCNTKPSEPQMASQLRAISTPYKEPRVRQTEFCRAFTIAEVEGPSQISEEM